MKKLFYVIIATIAPIIAFSFVSPASAVAQDITYNIDKNSTLPLYFCDNTQTNSQVKCSDYSNIIYTPSGFNSGYLTLAIDSTTIRIPNFTTTIFDLSSVSIAFIAQLGGLTADNVSLTVTLTNSLDCPEPEPCDCPIDCTEPAIVQLFKSGFWGVATALVSVIVPILALFLVFRLVHDLFWGKG